MHPISTRHNSLPTFYRPSEKVVEIFNLFDIPYKDRARLERTIKSEEVEIDPSYLIDFLYKKYHCEFDTFIKLAQKVEEILKER